MSDRSKLENQEILQVVLERLGVVPVAEGSWTAARLAQGEVLATWSLVVALAVRFGCNRPIPPSVPLTVQELTVQDGDVDNPVKVGGAPPRSLPALGSFLLVSTAPQWSRRCAPCRRLCLIVLFVFC